MAATPLKKKALVRIAFNRSKEDGLNYKGWNLLFAPGLQATNRGGMGWVLVHEDSGLLIGPAFRTLDDAMDFARKLAPVTDWTQGKDAVAVSDIYTEVSLLVREEMGRRFAAAFPQEETYADSQAA